MNFTLKINTFFGNIKSGILRFLYAGIVSLLIFGVIAYSVVFEFGGTCEKLLFSLSSSLIVSILFKLIAEKADKPSFISPIAGILTFTVNIAVLIKVPTSNSYYLTSYFGILIAIVCVIAALLFTDENREIVIPYILKNLLFSFAVALILSTGVCLCLWAFNVLLISLPDSYKQYEIALAFIWTVIFPNMFLAYIPKADEKLTLPKVFKTVVLYVALPVYILLMAVLYAYLIKILVTRNMPVGQINWFASFASLFFVFFLFNVRQYQDKLARIFVKLIGYFIIPVIIMQLAAVYQRISAYGLTTPRSVSLVLILISIIFALYSIFGKKTEHVFWIVPIIILAVTVIPKVNIIDLPKESQEHILKSTLTKYGMLKDGGKIVNSETQISEEDQEKILSSFGYLRYAAEPLPECVETNKESYDNGSLFEFSGRQTSSDDLYLYYSSEESKNTDITKYTSMKTVSVYDYTSEATIDYIIPFDDIVKTLYGKYGESCGSVGIIDIDENTSFYVNRIDAAYDKKTDTFEYINVDGILLTK